MKWNKENIRKLKEFWPKKTSSEIAKLIGSGITRNAVIGKASRLGLSKSQSIPKQKASIPDSEDILSKEISREIETSFLFEKVSFDNQCQWLTEEVNGCFNFCNKKTEEGKPYCSEHCVIAYRK